MKERFDAALAAYERGDLAEALEGFRMCAEAGSAKAQFNLAVMYHNGEGAAKDDGEAARWMRYVAEQGLAIAQWNLGTMYGKGEGVEKNATEAALWYRRAAEQGDADMQCALGTMYRYGENVEKNVTDAMLWYRQAAYRGHAFAQFSIGGMYRNGEGVARDEDKANRWNQLAVAQDLAIAYAYLPPGKGSPTVMITHPQKFDELLQIVGLTDDDLLVRLMKFSDYLRYLADFGSDINRPRRKKLKDQGVSEATLRRARNGQGMGNVRAEIVQLELEAAAREAGLVELIPITLHDMGAVETKVPRRRRRRRLRASHRTAGV